MRPPVAPAVTLALLCGLAVGCAPPPRIPGGSLAVALDGEWSSDHGPRRLPLRDPVGDLTIARPLVLPEGWDEATRVVLRGNGVGWRVRASVGDRAVGSDAGGLRPLAIDLTGALGGGTNALRLRVEAPRPDNVLLGRDIPTVAAYTYSQPRPGQVELRGELWLEVAAARRIDDLDVRFDDGRLHATARVTGAEGETLRFVVTRDGAELARFPDATVSGGVARAEVAWTGPTWTLGGDDAPFLQYLVAALPDGTTGQLRFAARDVERRGRGLALDGAPLYLAVQRHTPRSDDPRAELAELAALYGRAGMNALELHAAMHADAFLAAADELGFPVVLTPRCDGRRQDDGPLAANAEWAAFVQEGNARIATAGRDHPSVLLWNIEAPAERAFPLVYAAYADAGAPAVDLRESNGYSDESYARMRAYEPLPAFLNELAFQQQVVGGKTLLERLEPLLVEHRPFGIGITLPHVIHMDANAPPEQRDGYVRGLAEMLARAQVPALPTGPRRGPAYVDVTVTRGGVAAAGEIVVLTAPGQAPIAAATDTRGLARLVLDYAGPAEVRLFEGASGEAVQLVPGRYEGGRWAPSVARAALVAP